MLQPCHRLTFVHETNWRVVVFAACPILAAQILLGVKDGVVRSRLHAQKRTRDILAATEERIAALKAELAESEHHVVGLNNGEIRWASQKENVTARAHRPTKLLYSGSVFAPSIR